MAYNSTTVPRRPKVSRTVPGSYAFQSRQTSLSPVHTTRIYGPYVRDGPYIRVQKMRPYIRPVYTGRAGTQVSLQSKKWRQIWRNLNSKYRVKYRVSLGLFSVTSWAKRKNVITGDIYVYHG